MNETLIRQKFNQAAQGSFHFAAIRLPNETAIHFLYSRNDPQLIPVSLHTQGVLPAFVCSPYSGGNLAYTLQAEHYYLNGTLKGGEPLAETLPNQKLYASLTQNFIATKDAYEKYVEDGINAIVKNKLDKMVAARCAETILATGFDAATYYAKLIETYPHACVYFFHLKGIGTWCGATPEKLLTVENGKLETVALAGTKIAESATEWTAKEYDEHYMTEAFIEQLFRELKLTGFRKSAIETIEAGAIQHLCSNISWKPKPDLLKQKFGKILAGLNPTPAVCGLPQFEASLFIAVNEQLERRFYSGFVGLLQPTATNLYVNLRCMEIGNEKAILYAGAGITQDSNPQAEWEETERKMQTMLSVLNAI